MKAWGAIIAFGVACALCWAVVIGLVAGIISVIGSVGLPTLAAALCVVVVCVACYLSGVEDGKRAGFKRGHRTGVREALRSQREAGCFER